VVSAPISLGAINPLASDTSLGSCRVPLRQYYHHRHLDIQRGVGGVGETDYHYNSYQAYDDLLYSRGNQTLKFGGAFERIQSNVFAGGDQIGRYTFGSLTEFFNQ